MSTHSAYDVSVSTQSKFPDGRVSTMNTVAAGNKLVAGFTVKCFFQSGRFSLARDHWCLPQVE